MTNVRTPVEADIPAMIAMGARMHAESPRYRHMDYAEDKIEALIRETLESTLASPAPGGIFIAEEEGKIIGIFWGFVTELFCSHTKVACDNVFYIMPEYRGKARIAVKLLLSFERWAKEQGAEELLPGVSSMINDELVVGFYEAFGYTFFGRTAFKRIAK